MKSPLFDCYLLNGNITIFCGTHSEASKQDILNSSLYAALVTSQRRSDPEENWDKYRDTVSKLHWTINSRENKRVDFDKCSMIQLIARSAENALPPEELNIVSNALFHMKSIGDDSPVLEMFLESLRSNFSAVTGGTYTAVTIVRTDKSIISIQMLFEATDPIDTDILELPILTSISGNSANVRVMRSALDERQYAAVRETIIKKLGPKIETHLIHIP